MGSGLETAHPLVTALLNLAVAVFTGATVSHWWLARHPSGWADMRRRPVRSVALAGAVVALASDIVWLWMESAAMAEVPVYAASNATWTMATSTHLGLAWGVGFAALTVAAILAGIGDGRRTWSSIAAVAALAVFWYTRSMVSHAASDGDFSVRMLADWVHLGLINLWVGEVIVAGGIMLRATRAMATADRRARAVYVTFLSDSATTALAGIVVTGLYATWRSVRSIDDLVGTPYGNTLVAKLLLVAVAVLLGGVNRLVVMPPWLSSEAADDAAPPALPRRFKRILLVEAAVLLATVVVASWLVSTAPPRGANIGTSTHQCRAHLRPRSTAKAIHDT
ncbi:CopD family protein [Massilia pinisoli]|uniref:CopD family protein n=1 Tax=Massilia pinisoli TaxID=1772194 RepID=A0ABT1ZK05_9BURK|nr:CopD family protein [Massilia pinisoli]MCS0580246.1 CopD family protein [Massilia pinisoli]